MTTAIQPGAALLLVLLSRFFVAAEFSLARARTTRLEQMAAEGRARADLAREEARHIDRYPAACQLGITLASRGSGARRARLRRAAEAGARGRRPERRDVTPAGPSGPPARTSRRCAGG